MSAPRSATVATSPIHRSGTLPVDAYVVDSSGAPVVGASVLATGFADVSSFVPTGSMIATTASDGSFSGGADLGSVIVFSVSVPVVRGSYGPGGQYQDATSGRVVISSWRSSASIGVGTPPTLTLPRIVAATVTVTDAAGRPAVGATVASPGWNAPCGGLQCRQIATYASLVPSDPSIPMRCTTDALGQCALPSLPGTSSSLSASLLGGIPWWAGTFTMGSGTTTFTIGLPRQATLTGTIADSAGVPVVGASVTVMDNRGDTEQVVTGIGGGYSFSVPDGIQVSLEVDASVADGSLQLGGQGSTTALGSVRIDKFLQVSGVSPLDLTVPRISMMPVHVVDHGGAALAGTGVWVGASDVNGDWVLGSPSQLALGGPPRVTFSPGLSGPFGCTTDVTGTCALPVLDGASTLASIEVPAAVPFGKTLVATVGGAPATVTMPTPLVISGTVTDATGAAVAGASVRISPSGTSRGGSSITDRSGHYTFLAFVPGSYRWELTASSTGVSFTGTGGGQVGQAGSFHTQRDLSVAANTTQDFTLPALVPVTFHAPVGETLAVFWLGDASIVQAGPPTMFGSNPTPFTCTVDAGGTCTVPGAKGMTGWLVQVGSGLPVAYVTADRSPTEIWLVGSAGRSAGTIQVSSPDGLHLRGVSSATVSSGTLPSGFVPVAGQIAFTASGLRPGQSTSFTVTLPAGSKPTNILKVVAGAVVDASAIATVVGDTVTIQATDGGVGDEDGVANGTIVDPIVPVIEPPTAPSVVQSPTDVSVAAGQAATFVARATGSPAPTTSWQTSTDGGASWSSLPGATGPSLAITTTTASDGALVRAQFASTSGTSSSAPATVHLTGFHLHGILPSAMISHAYSAQLSAIGGIAPYKWKKLAPLPKGLTLSSSGLLSGTLSKKLAPGSYPISVQASDATRKHPQVLQATWTLVVH